MRKSTIIWVMLICRVVLAYKGRKAKMVTRASLNKKAAELNAREKSLQDYANILDEQATENRKLNAEAQFVKEKYETLLSEFDKLRATA